MGVRSGHFDQVGNACLKLHLCGVAHTAPGIEHEALIDTGFTGFLHLPFHHAFSLQLPLFGTLSITLADGSQATNLTALVRTTFDGKEVLGLAILSPGSQDILIGMDFLRQFKLGLIVAKGHVILPSEDWLEEAFRQQAAAAAAAASSAATPSSASPPALTPADTTTPTDPQN